MNTTISLNFFPLAEDDFSITIYRKQYVSGTESSPSNTKVWSLPVHIGKESSEYRKYSVSFDTLSGYEKAQVGTWDNQYLTLAFLYHQLVRKTQQIVSTEKFRIEKGIYQKVLYVLETFPEGNQVVWLQPYFLHTKGELGFLCDFSFVKDPKQKFNKEVLKLSLSLNDKYKENRDFYADKYEKIQLFANKYLGKIFPIEIDTENTIFIERNFGKISASQLKVKKYLFRDGNKSNSQFMGLKKYGPLEEVTNSALLYFVYRPQDKPLSYDLYRALRGETFKTFPGMENMFNFPLHEGNVKGISIDEFNKDNIETVIQDIRQSVGERFVVPVVILPWNKNDRTERNNYIYHLMKHMFLKFGIPTQFVSLDTLEDPNVLKWSVSNIGLGIFSKMGGIPWKVEPRNERCLIIGIGQSHTMKNGNIERYFAYSVLTDSSGLYEDLKVLGRSRDMQEYLIQFQKRLKDIIDEYSDRFDQFVIHSTFSLKKNELDAIQKTLKRYSEEIDGEKVLIAIKLNDKNRFFGFSPQNNSLIPYESTYSEISPEEYLVWFEGLQYGNPNVYKRIGGPTHIRFIYPENNLDQNEMRGFLQDALNLSGANWRGFNAKSSPISVYYAYQIAKYFREFSKYEFDEIELENLTPWFL